MKRNRSPNRVYLDNAATTPVREEVAEIVKKEMEKNYGNASSVHWTGQLARKALEEARERVAGAIGADSEEIIFTSGGTESDNLAIRGTAYALQERGKHIITTPIEHHAVLNTCESLAGEGFEITYLPVDKKGLVDPEAFKSALRSDTILASVMFANNETGTLEPVEELARIANERGVAFHTDAVQAVGKIPVDVKKLGVHLLAISGHKFYGPKGVGALFVKKGHKILPYSFGGHHEKGLRPGTENVPGIVGMAHALELACAELAFQSERIRALKQKLEEGIIKNVESAIINTPKENCLPNILNVSFPGVDGEALLLALDLAGIAVSTGSACSSGSTDPSHVLLAMGIPPRIAQGSIRFSFGRENTENEVDYVLDLLPSIIEKLRRVSKGG